MGSNPIRATEPVVVVRTSTLQAASGESVLLASGGLISSPRLAGMPEERRVVTVLFADIAGSTALAHANDPEDVRALMAAYYAIATRVIAGRGGTLEKFIGDAVMAVFGVPQAHGDDPDRALGAAAALRDAVAADPLTCALGVRIGVNTGEVIATREAGRDFLVTGDAVNIAARLQQNASPGEIVAGQRTIDAVGPRFHFSAPQALTVKGKPDPIGCAVLAAIVENAPARWTGGPFVGRTSDLAQLRLAALRAFDESRPQLVTVSAPAGTGKSRLIEEFAGRIRIERPELRVTTAQCLPFGAAITYLPMRGLLAGLLDAGPELLSIELVSGGLRDCGVDPTEAARVATLVGATLGLDAEIGPREREEFFTAWRAAVEGLSARRPTMLVLEDLHWASDSLLDLIEHVVQPRTRAPLLMVALTRPELFDRRAAWGSARRNATSIALEALEDAEARLLVGALLPDLDAETRDRITERAEGNPFFAAELARSYREHGDGAPLPDSVQATMLARLDLLPDIQRRTLQLGAIVGRTIEPAALAQLLGGPPDQVLESLAERDFVVPQTDGSYSFRHIVIRDVAYGTLTRAERAAAHLALARWLADRTDGGLELVAHHYRQAITHSPHGLTDLDRSGAVAALELAAAFAKRTGAPAEAIALLQDALKVAPPADRMRLNEALGDVTEITDGALAAFGEAFRLWEQLPADARDPVDGARLLRKQLVVHVRWAASTRAPIEGAAAQAILAHARGLLSPAERYERARLDVCEAFLASGGFFIPGGPEVPGPSLERGRSIAEAARKEFARSGDSLAESEALDVLGALAQREGDYDRAVAAARQRLALNDLTLLERGDAAGMVCWANLLGGRYDVALEAFDAYISTLRPGEPEAFYPLPHVLGATAARTAGRWDDALRVADRLDRQLDRSRQLPPVIAVCWANAGYVARARLDQARLQRYSAICAQAVEGIAADSPFLALFRSFYQNEPAVALEYLGRAAGNVFVPAALIPLLLFEYDTLVPEATLQHIETVVRPQANILTERVALVRAARAGPDALRNAIGSLARAGILGDVPRTAGLLARLTGDPTDLADADRRLKALGDLEYVARLTERATLREP